MPLDPQLRSLLAMVEAFAPAPLSAGTPAGARQALRALTVDVRLLNSSVPVGEVTERTVRVDHARLRLRIYRPAGRRLVSRPTLVFFHGGGFVIGDLDTHDTLCRQLCRDVDAVVVAVAYRLAPEHPFPAAVEDGIAATRWVADHVGQLGGDTTRLAVAGDSAGGNLAAVVAQAWRRERRREQARRGRPPLAAQLLLYPAVDLEDDDGLRYPSRREHAEGALLTGDDLRWFGDHYLGTVRDRRDPRVSPINGVLDGLPPAVIVTGEVDPLRDEAEAYAARLRAAGVDVVLRRFDGLVHGFAHLAALSRACAAAMAATCSLVKAVLDRAAEGHPA